MHNHHILPLLIDPCTFLWGYIYTKYSITKSPILELTNQIQAGLYTLRKLKIDRYRKIWEILLWRNAHTTHVLYFLENLARVSPKWPYSAQNLCRGIRWFVLIAPEITSEYHCLKTLFFKIDYRKNSSDIHYSVWHSFFLDLPDWFLDHLTSWSLFLTFGIEILILWMNWRICK